MGLCSWQRTGQAMNLKYIQHVSKSEQPRSKSLIDEPVFHNKPLSQNTTGNRNTQLNSLKR